jgi:glycine cleavage system H protein
MKDLMYSEDHEWVLLENGIATVGISDYAQEQLGDIVYIELPQIDTETVRDEEVAVIESVKAASDVKTPISGIIVAINDRLSDDPGLVNADPTGDGWLFKLDVTNDGELNDLMDENAYRDYVEGLD